MDRQYGYTQYRLDVITRYANSINEQAVRMEMAWQNRDNFKDDVDVDMWLRGQKLLIEETVESFLDYLEPMRGQLDE